MDGRSGSTRIPVRPDEPAAAGKDRPPDRGQVVEAGELDQFARSLPHREVPITETWVRPLWDLPGILPAIFLLRSVLLHRRMGPSPLEGNAVKIVPMLLLCLLVCVA